MKVTARRMARDPDWVRAYLYFKRTGNLHKPYDAHVPEHLDVILSGDLEDAIIYQLQQRQYEAVNPASDFSGRMPENPLDPIETGDALIDKWEREFAEGLTPDLEEEL